MAALYNVPIFLKQNTVEVTNKNKQNQHKTITMQGNYKCWLCKYIKRYLKMLNNGKKTHNIF